MSVWSAKGVYVIASFYLGTLNLELTSECALSCHHCSALPSQVAGMLQNPDVSPNVRTEVSLDYLPTCVRGCSPILSGWFISEWDLICHRCSTLPSQVAGMLQNPDISPNSILRVLFFTVGQPVITSSSQSEKRSINVSMKCLSAKGV